MISLARALVRRSKVVILDEATSSVDDDNDERIQKAIRSEFKELTLITIAHRLRTVMDYDKILVLKKGRVLEYYNPSPFANSDLILQSDCWKKGGFFMRWLRRLASTMNYSRLPNADKIELVHFLLL